MPRVPKIAILTPLTLSFFLWNASPCPLYYIALLVKPPFRGHPERVLLYKAVAVAVFHRLYDGTPTEGGGLIESLTTRSGVFIFSYCPKRRTLRCWSSNAAEVLGVRDNEIATEGNLFLKYAHPEDRFTLLTELESALADGTSYHATYRWIRPDCNEIRWLHCRGALSADPLEPLFEGCILDISETLRQTGEPQADTATLLSAFPNLFCVLDLDLRVTRLHIPEGSNRFTFGDPTFRADRFRVGCVFIDCFSDDELKHHYQRVLSELVAGRRAQFQTRVSVADSTYNLQLLPVRQHETISGVLVLAADSTELVRLERRLAELQRNEGLATLAAGVAHHFNNALQGILGQAAIVQHHPERADLVKRSGQTITELVQRASELTRQLFAFDTSDSQGPTPVDPNVVVLTTTNRLHDLFSSGIKVSVALGNPPSVLLHQEQLVHAIEAVLRNACESMRQGGTLLIRTSDALLADHEVDDLPAGGYAVISIADSGEGMTPEAARRCFEPFFTTKERDPHTGLGLKNPGLGLSGALATLRQYGGTIRATTRAGTGTTIAFYLPAMRTSPAGDRVRERKDASARVLIVDDDEMVLSTIQALLQESGYPAQTFLSPQTALEAVQQRPGQFLAAFIDAVMPSMDGPTLIRKLATVAPGLRMIGFSGASQAHLQRLTEAGAVAVLRKPVDPEKLREALYLALGAPKAA